MAALAGATRKDFVTRTSIRFNLFLTTDGSEQFEPRTVRSVPTCQLRARESQLVKKSVIDADSLSVAIPLTPRLWIPKALLEDAQDIWLIKNIPVIPLFDLLIIKMQGPGWRDHRASRREDLRALLAQAQWLRISYQKEYCIVVIREVSGKFHGPCASSTSSPRPATHHRFCARQPGGHQFLCCPITFFF